MKKYIQTLLLLFLLCSVKDIFASPAKQVNSWNNLSSSSTTGIFQNGTQTLTDLNQALSINISSSNYTPKAAYSFFHNKKLLHSFYIMTLPLQTTVIRILQMILIPQIVTTVLIRIITVAMEPGIVQMIRAMEETQTIRVLMMIRAVTMIREMAAI